MFREEKNLKEFQKDTVKDPERKPLASYGAGTSNMSVIFPYTKTNKLITALYMVTDIIDKDEPLRNKLRTLGTEIISDPEQSRQGGTYGAGMSVTRIEQVISFLDIASAVNIISEMNASILKKEFLELSRSVKESTGEIKTINRRIDLSEFFTEEFPPLRDSEGAGGGNSLITTSPFGHSSSTRRREISKGHVNIGVQRGDTLLKAIKNMSNTNKKSLAPYQAVGFGSGFDILKKQRREDIINIIKTIGGSATIKDIKDRAKGFPKDASSLVSCSEKTLQRELVSMVKDSVLNREGSKRWSRYFLSK